MNQNRLKSICTSVIKHSHPELELVDFDMFETYKYDELMDSWITDFSIFIQMSRSSKSCDKSQDVESLVESVFGFSCCVNFT
jgi:hypothetical protein